MLLSPLSSIYLSNPSTISIETPGFIKFAVPTATALAPASKNSTASFTVKIPPIPMIGIFTALYTCQTILTATGLMAGPDKPPVTLASRGFHVSVSIDMPSNVFITDRPSAPSSSHTLAKEAISVTFGDSFIRTGNVVAFLTICTTLRVDSMSVPKAIPPSLTFGQDILTSSPSTPSTPSNRLATSPYSSTVEPNIFTNTLVLNFLRKGSLSLIKASTPILGRPMAFNIPEG